MRSIQKTPSRVREQQYIFEPGGRAATKITVMPEEKAAASPPPDADAKEKHVLQGFKNASEDCFVAFAQADSREMRSDH
jgi:hypothetical protein